MVHLKSGQFAGYECHFVIVNGLESSNNVKMEEKFHGSTNIIPDTEPFGHMRVYNGHMCANFSAKRMKNNIKQGTA
jgi:hypothetical protein